MNAVTKLNTQPQDAESTQGKVGHHNVTRKKKKEVSGVVHSARFCVICQHSLFWRMSCETLSCPGTVRLVLSAVFRSRQRLTLLFTKFHIFSRYCLQTFCFFHFVSVCSEELFLRQCCLDCSKNGAWAASCVTKNSSSRCRCRVLWSLTPFAAALTVALCRVAADGCI